MPITTVTSDEMVNKVITKLQSEFGNTFWEGKITDRKNTLRRLNKELNTIFNKETIVFTKKIPHFYNKWENSSASYYIRDLDTIVLKGRISLITYLHEYAHSILFDIAEATGEPTPESNEPQSPTTGLDATLNTVLQRAPNVTVNITRESNELLCRTFSHSVFKTAYPDKWERLNGRFGGGLITMPRRAITQSQPTVPIETPIITAPSDTTVTQKGNWNNYKLAHTNLKQEEIPMEPEGKPEPEDKPSPESKDEELKARLHVIGLNNRDN